AVGAVLRRDVNASERPTSHDLDGLDACTLACDGLPDAALDQLATALLEVQLAGSGLRGVLFGVATRLGEAFPLVSRQFLGLLHERGHGRPGARALGDGAQPLTVGLRVENDA